MNTGKAHPFAVKRNESGLGTRGASVPLINRSKVWMCHIWIGTPPESFNLQIDTGAADMWVLQDGCDGISKDAVLWDPYSSDSSKYEGQSFEIGYGDGTTVKGNRYTDIVTIGGFTADPQTFGSTTSYTSTIPYNGYTDGLLGLAFPSISKFGADTLFESLVRQNKLTNPTFSLKLSESSSGAEMYVGGANRMLYKGGITYTRVTDPGFWKVSMDDFRVNGDKVFENIPAVFDTGASYIFGDWERVSEFYKRFDGTLDERKGFGYYSIRCDSFPTVSFTFGGKTFEIHPEALKLNPVGEGSPDCFGAIVAYRLDRVEFWTIGMPFLQGVYSVFDYGMPQVGFADLA